LDTQTPVYKFVHTSAMEMSAFCDRGVDRNSLNAYQAINNNYEAHNKYCCLYYNRVKGWERHPPILKANPPFHVTKPPM